jgi:hypothetical protein
LFYSCLVVVVVVGVVALPLCIITMSDDEDYQFDAFDDGSSRM